MSSARRIAMPTVTRVPSAPRVSSKLVRACAAFGVLPEPKQHHKPQQSELTDQVLAALKRHRVVQICGRSGAGKTSLLRGVQQRLSADRRVHSVPEALSQAQRTISVFDLFSGSVEERGALLAQAGLGEPRLWALPSGLLSVGERARLRLALTMQGAGRGDVVIADEFASTIDRLSAHALARTAARWSKGAGATLLVASAHEDLESMLMPCRVIDASTQRVRRPISGAPRMIEIETGTSEDYQSLAHLHYRGGGPGVPVLTLRAMRDAPSVNKDSRRVLAGVLVVSMPTLNGVWRQRAWPGAFSSGDKRRDALRLNEQVRVISRVIVAPHSRGLGVATDLVRSYLANPLTQGTEAVAAMGSVCPFLDRAGMVGYDLPLDRTDTRLLDALDHLGVGVEDLIRMQPQPGTLLHRELLTWARARKLLPAGVCMTQDLCRLIPLAVCRLCSRPRAYAFVKGERQSEQRQAKQR